MLYLFGLLGLHKYFNSLKGTAPYNNATDEMHGAFTDTYLLWGQGVHNYRVLCNSEDPKYLCRPICPVAACGHPPVLPS